LKKRRWGAVIRLEADHKMDPAMLEILNRKLEIPENGMYSINGPLDLTFLMKLTNIDGFDNLRYPPLIPKRPPLLRKDDNIFKVISDHDILLHHPYDSFDSVVDFVNQAANDPDVMAIKSTLYRVSLNSPIVEALARAAENGKQVTVLLEIKARFDEENNITWAKRLDQAGCNVIYSQMGIKIHCKMILIVRREENRIKRYIHLGTGNYNDDTARLYVDLGLFTANPYLASDVAAVFNMLTSYSHLSKTYKIAVSPLNMRKTIIKFIRQEKENALKGQPAYIIAKVNSLLDYRIIVELYEASQAGVKIDLIVRGISALLPGIKGISENIRIRSIVGRFLEHSRIFLFCNGGHEQIYISSADWMERNMDRRVEIMFPIESEANKERIKMILNLLLQDNVKARLLNNDGTYSRINKRGRKLVDSQLLFSLEDY
jgi:polyphosphate kinase